MDESTEPKELPSTKIRELYANVDRSQSILSEIFREFGAIPCQSEDEENFPTITKTVKPKYHHQNPPFPSSCDHNLITKT